MRSGVRLAGPDRAAGRGIEGRRQVVRGAAAAAVKPAGTATAAFCSPGEADHLPLHEGGAVACRYVRLQAEPPARRRQALAVRQAPGPVRRDRDAPGLALEVPAS